MKIGSLEQRQIKLESDTDKRFEEVYRAIQNHDLKPKQGIFYDGQVFDAYTFIADLIREAKHSIVLVDNYIDDTVLKMFAKRGKNVSLSIYTKKDCILSLDLAKYQAQYGSLTVKEFKHAHDRFKFYPRECAEGIPNFPSADEPKSYLGSFSGLAILYLVAVTELRNDAIS